MALTESLANEAATTLTGPILSGATTLTVTSSSGFPKPPFRARLSGTLTAGGTGIEYIAVSAVAGASWTVTRGAEAPYSVGLGFATGAKVEQVLTARTLLTTPYVNVKAFGATGDGTTDDVTAINNAITYAAGLGVLGGGTVFFPPGTYKHSATIVLKSNVRLLGSGREATTLQRTADVVGVSAYGTATGTDGRCYYAAIEQMTLHGSDYSSTLLDMVYASQFLANGVRFNAVVGRAIDMVEVWDSNFTNIFIEWCGGEGVLDQPCIHIRNARTGSGFGSSTDSSNEIRFTHLHFESFRAGAVRIEPGVGSEEVNGVYLFDVKAENGVISGTCPFFYFDEFTDRIHLQRLYAYAGGLLDGGPVNIVQIQSTRQISVRDAFISGTDAEATVASGVHLNAPAGTGMTVIDGIYGQYQTAPTVAHINVAAANGLRISNVRTNMGTLVAGYELDAARRQTAITADATTTATTAGLLTSMTFAAVLPGTYELALTGMYRSSINTAGPRFGVGGTATFTSAAGQIVMNTSTTAATATEITGSGSTAGTNPGTATTSFPVTMTLVVVVSAFGTVGLLWNMSAAGTGTLRAGSTATLTRIR